MQEMIHQKFFFFYDFLNDGFVELALKFFEDPWGFNVDEAKEEAENKQENDQENSVSHLVKPEKKLGESPYTIHLPN